ncbi:MAG: class I SAM-dependent methyltransferase, partial [Pseudomonadota bacterium]
MAPRPKFALDEQSAITAELADKVLYDDELKLDAAQLTLFKGQLAIVLEVADAEFKRNIAAAGVVGRLAQNLHQLRAQAGPNIWKNLIPIAQNHAVNTFLQQDPFTRWSFEKPRGYSGDATLLDIYYQHKSAQEIVAASTPLGQEIYAYTSNADSSVAGRERRDILAQYVDDAAKNNPEAEVL